MFGSRYNLHVAMAWADRQNDPELVQDEYQPKTRAFHEKEDMARHNQVPPLDSSPRPLGRIVPVAAVLGPDGWKRRGKGARGRARRRRRERRRGSLTSDPPGRETARGQRGPRGVSRRHKLQPLGEGSHLAGRGGDQRLPMGVQPFLGDEVAFLAQYRAYTNTRALLDDEGFFDAHHEDAALAQQQFGFERQEELLSPVEAREKEEEDEEEDLTTRAAEAGHRERLRAERRVVISSKPPLSTVIPDTDSADTGVDTQLDSRENTEWDIWCREVGDTSGSEGATSGQRDRASTGGSQSSQGVERTGSATTGTPDLMSRFYARLQELKETKEEDERGVSSGDASTRNKDRRRIKTALRRLLSSRLFPDKFPDQNKGKPSLPSESRDENSTFDDGSSMAFTPGTMTPLTLGSKSKTISLHSRQIGEGGGDATRQGTRGKVVFVAESSHLTSSSTDPSGQRPDQSGHRPDQSGQSGQETEVERVAYYRRHPLAPVRAGGISRLYQPARPPSRARTSLSQSALHRDGLRRDRTFLQRITGHTGVREDTRWSLPGEKGPEDYDTLDTTERKTEGVWRRDRESAAAWAYNLPLQGRPPAEGEPQTTDGATARQGFTLRNLDDLQLRRLLEELYRDKKYMDRIIDTKEADDETEQEVCDQLAHGREYLMSRARFWLEKGPLPPRPPTTDLGMRLQRERTMQSRMGAESRREGALSRQRTDLSRVTSTRKESREGGAEPTQQKDSSPDQVGEEPTRQVPEPAGGVTGEGSQGSEERGQESGQVSDKEGGVTTSEEHAAVQNEATRHETAQESARDGEAPDPVGGSSAEGPPPTGERRPDSAQDSPRSGDMSLKQDVDSPRDSPQADEDPRQAERDPATPGDDAVYGGGGARHGRRDERQEPSPPYASPLPHAPEDDREVVTPSQARHSGQRSGAGSGRQQQHQTQLQQQQQQQHQQQQQQQPPQQQQQQKDRPPSRASRKFLYEASEPGFSFGK